MGLGSKLKLVALAFRVPLDSIRLYVFTVGDKIIKRKVRLLLQKRHFQKG